MVYFRKVEHSELIKFYAKKVHPIFSYTISFKDPTITWMYRTPTYITVESFIEIVIIKNEHSSDLFPKGKRIVCQAKQRRKNNFKPSNHKM